MISFRLLDSPTRSEFSLTRCVGCFCSPFTRFVALGLLVAASAGAMEIPADVHVKFTPENAILGHFSATKKPVATVKSGTVVRIDGGGGARWRDEDPNEWLKKNNIPTTVETCPALAETILVLKETKNRLPPATPAADATTTPAQPGVGAPTTTPLLLLQRPPPRRAVDTCLMVRSTSKMPRLATRSKCAFSM